jgi:hypothetical protein
MCIVFLEQPTALVELCTSRSSTSKQFISVGAGRARELDFIDIADRRCIQNRAREYSGRKRPVCMENANVVTSGVSFRGKL